MSVTTTLTGDIIVDGHKVGNFKENPELKNMSYSELTELIPTGSGTGGSLQTATPTSVNFTQPQGPDLFPTNLDFYNQMHGVTAPTLQHAQNDWNQHHIGEDWRSTPVLVPTPVPTSDPFANLLTDPIATMQDLGVSPPIFAGGISSVAIQIIPRAATIIRAAAGISSAGKKAGAAGGIMGGITGGSLFQKGLAALGILEVSSWLFSTFNGSSEADQLGELIQELVDSDFINVPGVRRDGTTGANNWLHWNLADSGARPFLTSEYINRNFVKAVQKNERTPRFRGRPRARGRRN